MTATLQTKVKIEQGTRIGRVPYKRKEKIQEVNKAMQQAGKVPYKNKQAKYI